MRVAATTGTEDRYAVAMGELWSGLAQTMARLEVVAGCPDGLEDARTVASLRRLQYALHLASEEAYGLQPPPGARTAHAELGAALATARDATAEVAEAASAFGAEGVAPLLYEWRGTLFRVRLARLRLAPAEPAPAEADGTPGDGIARPLAAFVLALLGALAFVGGAATGRWPLWVAGMLAVAASCLVYRP